MIKAIILGSARGIRHLDPNRSYPLSLHELGGGGRVLDWILHAFSSQNIDLTNTVFVGGYHLEKVIEAYPGLKYYFHPQWQREGAVGALRMGMEEISGPCFICDTNVVFRSEALALLRKNGGDVAVGMLGEPNDRCVDGHLVGLAWFNEDGAMVLRHLLSQVENRMDLDLKGLFQLLISHGVDIQAVDIRTDCAELRDQTSLSRFIFGSKAQTLDRLRPVLQRAVVLDQIRFFVHEWETTPRAIMAGIRDAFGDTAVVVRSSAAVEDSWTSSQAGRFTSVLNVNAARAESLTDAINTVVDSYLKAGIETSKAKHEVFVQPYLKNVTMSGVVLTRDLERGTPYYIITMDRTTGRTDTVTSGIASTVETFVVYRNAQLELSEPFLTDVISVAQELERLIGHDSLDIEFAVDSKGKLYVFQVRPLVNRRDGFGLADTDFDDELMQVRRFVRDLMQPHPHLKGQTTVLGNMPDWNPAEMIGVAPRPLALSLYQVLITDFAWAEARRQIDYRDVTSEPLLIALAGIPYIDLRASFNSFLPATLDDDIAERLVNVYLDYLKLNPELHDKIEFEVAVTCLAFDFKHHIERLRAAGLSDSDITALQGSLLDLTDAILREEMAPIDLLESEVQRLTVRRDAVLAQKDKGGGLPRTISWLIRDCVRYGTIPFSILARYAFIAMTFMKSLHQSGVLNTEEYQAFLNAIPTVATDVSGDLRRLISGTLSQEAFVMMYGHLRPGTYDILSPNYAQSIHTFLSGSNEPRNSQHFSATPGEKRPDPKIAIRIFNSKRSQISSLLKEYGFQCDAQMLLNFILRAIPAREWAKFEFTKNVNQIVELVAEYCGDLGLSREDASYLSIERISRLGTDSASCATRTYFKRIIGFEAKRHLLTTAIRLPHLIQKATDIDGFRLLEWHPNFITDQRVIAEVVDLERQPSPQFLQGRIALIRGADPGYDWIFSYQPAGLITQFGGAASHMAIRAAEFGLPSAIGCGELIFERVYKASRIELDCASQQIRVIQ